MEIWRLGIAGVGRNDEFGTGMVGDRLGCLEYEAANQKRGFDNGSGLFLLSREHQGKWRWRGGYKAGRSRGIARGLYQYCQVKLIS